MARPLRIEYPGALYYVTSRGNEQKDVFKSQRDREKFLSYLESAVVRYGAVVHAWCLMSNHYHLLLETPSGNLSQIMRHINGAYTTYFNVKRKRAGHLFQGRYKGILVEADAYALELSRYMHLNPVRAWMVAKPEHYPWSSYHWHADGRKDELLTDHSLYRRLGKSAEARQSAYRALFRAQLGDTALDEIRDATNKGWALGSDRFLTQIEALSGRRTAPLPKGRPARGE